MRCTVATAKLSQFYFKRFLRQQRNRKFYQVHLVTENIVLHLGQYDKCFSRRY